MRRLPLLAFLVVHSALLVAEEPEPIAFHITPVTGRTFILTEKGFINTTPFKATMGFSLGLAAVQDRETDLWGFAALDGSIALKPRWRLVGGFDKDSRISVAQDNDTGLWGYIDTQGRWVIQPEWDACETMTNAGGAVVKKNRRWGLITREGRVLVEPQWDEAVGFLGGDNPTITPFRVGTKWGYANVIGQIIVTPRFDYARGHVACGLARIRKGGLGGYVDTQGEVVIEPAWPEVHPFYGKAGAARAAVKNSKGKWGFIDEQGELVIPHRYDEIEALALTTGPFAKGPALVKQGKLWGLINTAGKELIPCRWEYLVQAGNGRLVAGKKEPQGWRYRFVDLAGNIVRPIDIESLGIDARNGSWYTSIQTPGGRDYQLYRPDDSLVGTFHLDLDFPPPSKPVLRIETSMHTAPIWRVATDQTGTLVLTASPDKTARLWELKTSSRGSTTRLLQTLRLPVGADNEGIIYGCALSQDGRLAALGGITGNEWDGTHCIYLFDTATGTLVRRCTGMQGSVFDMDFSPDGQQLAVGLGVSGLRIFNTATGTLIAEDRDYGDRIGGLDWKDNRVLATTCDDSHLRRYEMPPPAPGQREVILQLTPAQKIKTTAGINPNTPRFSPDGKTLAVGFRDVAKVALYSANTLEPMPESTPGCESTNSSLSVISWSNDGLNLIAGGTWNDKNKNYPIRLWTKSGRGSYRDIPIAQNTILNLTPLPSGGWLFAAGDPCWGVVTQDSTSTKKSWTLGSPSTADLRDLGTNFRIAADATAVAFGYRLGNKTPAIFDVRERRLSVGDDLDLSSLRSPRLERSDLTITDWRNTLSPKLNGNPLAISPSEMSRSYAFNLPGSGLVLGADWTLRAFTPRGDQMWWQPAPGAVWAVNLSEMGKIVVAAYADGTIRWHRNDLGGREVLAFFPHADQKRWVLWTPEGYYDCSPGGEDLIGWHVNRGKAEAANFYPAAQFAATFYRPDVIDELLETWDTRDALKLADAKRPGAQPAAVADIAKVIAEDTPPAVELPDAVATGLEVNASPLTVRYRVRWPGNQHLRLMRVLVDGLPQTNLRPPLPEASGGTASVVVPVPQRDCNVTLFAEMESGRTSEGAVLRVRWAGATPPPPPPTPVTTGTPATVVMPATPAAAPTEVRDVLKPRCYVLALGCGDYTSLRDLSAPPSDAQAFADAWAAQKGRRFGTVETVVLNDKGDADHLPTKPNLERSLDWLKAAPVRDDKDVVVLYLGGHAELDSEQDYLFALRDYAQDNATPGSIGVDDLKKKLRKPCTVLVFLDTCHSAAGAGNLATRPVNYYSAEARASRDLTREVNGKIIVFSAATRDQVSIEDKSLGHGYFTLAVLEALGARKAASSRLPTADADASGELTIGELEAYLLDRVNEMSAGKQNPVKEGRREWDTEPIATLR